MKFKVSILVTALAAMGFGIAAGGCFALFRDLPQIRALESFKPSAITRIWSSDRELLAQWYVQRRTPIPFDQIPKPLIQALLATEDRNFYRHSGVDIKGVLRAIVKDILAGQFVEGASTLTQQLSKTLFLTPEKSILRKLKEAVLSFQLERRYTKDEILALYLNQVYFGSGAYGVADAAQTFFGTSLDRLTLAQCALIPAMVKAPSRYSPLVNKELARERRDIVLKQMQGLGMISQEAYETAKAEPVTTAPRPQQKARAPYFIESVRDTLEEKLGPSRLYKGGLSIWTTLSDELQQTAESAVEKGLLALEGRMKKRGIQTPTPQCALIAIDIPSGGILAMVGGRNFSQSKYNRAVNAMRQPGSAFKPIIYACALERGFSQASLLLDAPVIYRGADGKSDWQPENFSHGYLGEITFRKALALSKNIPVVRLTEVLGPAAITAFSHGLGINSPLASDLTLALGSSPLRLIELTAVYAIFPNQGRKISPYGILEVIGHGGEILWRPTIEKSVVISPETAAIMTDMLQGVVLEGTGRKAQSLGRPVGGKTGTTNRYRDALFVGFSPTLALGVWVGLDDNGTLGAGETGARAALPIWIDFMEKALAMRPYQEFDLPNSVTRRSMDPTTGRETVTGAKGSVSALFIK